MTSQAGKKTGRNCEMTTAKCVRLAAPPTTVLPSPHTHTHTHTHTPFSKKGVLQKRHGERGSVYQPSPSAPAFLSVLGSTHPLPFPGHTPATLAEPMGGGVSHPLVTKSLYFSSALV